MERKGREKIEESTFTVITWQFTPWHRISYEYKGGFWFCLKKFVEESTSSADFTDVRNEAPSSLKYQNEKFIFCKWNSLKKIT